ncbi:hypothetical protein [Pseudomonas aeruginosa]|nr:hypothetical protein [Pseudomonas aeruginosa]
MENIALIGIDLGKNSSWNTPARKENPASAGFSFLAGVFHDDHRR